jgi:hypothetical protein
LQGARKEQSSENREQRAENREQRAESREQRAESREQRAESRQHMQGADKEGKGIVDSDSSYNLISSPFLEMQEAIIGARVADKPELGTARTNY